MKFPRINWDNDIEKLDFSILDEEDRQEAERRLKLVMELYNLFKENVEGLENRRIPRSKLSKPSYHKDENIVDKKLFEL